jgi:hypothetical protein
MIQFKSQNWLQKNEYFILYENYIVIYCNTMEKEKITCDDCAHSYYANSFEIKNHIIACPYCNNRKLCENLNCDSCFSKSFASHFGAKKWNTDRNKETPREVFKYSDLKYWFKCFDCGNKFQSTPNNICVREICCVNCGN